MSKTKEDSRNKTIKLYHDFTGLSYKECRANLKACNWSLLDALMPGYDFNTKNIQRCMESWKEICKNMVKFGEDLAEALKSAVEPICEDLVNFSGALNELSKEVPDEVADDKYL